MKDRYLFKAKRIDNGEWVEGDLVHSIYKINDSCVGKYGSDVGMYQVDERTICQYTGLTDKNGNKIWENDIVLFEEEICTVSWSDKDAQFTIESEFVVENFGNVWSADCEVYGNLFDNPELVEGGAT